MFTPAFGTYGAPVYSNIVRYSGSTTPVAIQKGSYYGQYTVCDTAAQCAESNDSWTEFPGTVKDGQYVRLRLPEGLGSSGVQRDVYVEIAGVRSTWSVTKKPALDSDGDGLVDSLDPYPVDGNQPGPLMPHRFWRIQMSDWYTEDFQVLDPTDPPYKFGEVSLCLDQAAGWKCSNDENTNIVYSTSQPDGDEFLNDLKWKDSDWQSSDQVDEGHTWYMGPEGFVTYDVIQSQKPFGYDIKPSSLDPYAWQYYTTIELQFSDNGSTWKTYEIREKADLSYGGNNFEVGVPKE